MEDIKLKMFEITMKIKDNSKKTLHRLDELKKIVSSQEKILNNLKCIEKQNEDMIPMDIF
jgi:hypothetical protein